MPKRRRDAFLRNRRPTKQIRLDDIAKTEEVQKWLDRMSNPAKKRVVKDGKQ